MTDYYCDMEADFVDAAGTDNGANVYCGPGGVQAAIRGTAAATALAAGDTLYLKGTAHLTKWVGVGTTNDHAAWACGDVVRDNGGGAVLWAGVIGQSQVGASNKAFLVQLDIGYDFDSINDNKASGISNTTRADTDPTIVTVVCDGISVDTNSGSSAAGQIAFVGVNAAWANDGTQAIFDADGDATYCLFDANMDYLYFENLTCENATSDGIGQSGNPVKCMLINCRLNNNGGSGMGGYFQYTKAFKTQFNSNSATGLYLAWNDTACVACEMIDNGADGWLQYTSGMAVAIGCLAHDNASEQMNHAGAAAGVVAVNCVFDGENDTTSSDGLITEAQSLIIGNRFTHNDGAGKYGLLADPAGYAGYEDYNVFFDNTSTVDTGFRGGANDVNAAEDGYVDRATDDFNIATGKDIRSVAIELD